MIEGLNDEIDVYLLSEIKEGNEIKMDKPIKLGYFYLTTQEGNYLDCHKNGLIDLKIPLMINTEKNSIIMAYNEWKKEQKEKLDNNEELQQNI